jgi:O-antigen ligase
VQHTSGFNLLTSGKLLDEHRMANGQYRIFGFFGHPLSLAGAALVWFSVALFAFSKSMTTQSKVFSVSGWLWFTVSLMQSALVYMSGGRTALAVVILFWLMCALFIACSVVRSRFLGKWFESHPASARIMLLSLFGVLLAAVGFAVVSVAPQLSPRGIGGGTMGQGALGDRPLFWQTYLAMWSDSPLLGQGYFAIEHGVRTDYYVRGGLSALRDKFNAHNIFLEILAVSGVAGLMVMLAATALLYMNLRALSGHSPERKVLLGGLALALAANLLHGLTQNTFFDSAVTACYLGLIGLFVVPPARFITVKSEGTVP